MGQLKDNFRYVFGGAGKRKQHHRRVGEYSKKWGFTGIVMAQAKDDFTKIKEIEEANLLEFLFYLEWLYEGGDVDEDERKFQEQLRKNKKSR